MNEAEQAKHKLIKLLAKHFENLNETQRRGLLILAKLNPERVSNFQLFGAHDIAAALVVDKLVRVKANQELLSLVKCLKGREV